MSYSFIPYAMYLLFCSWGNVESFQIFEKASDASRMLFTLKSYLGCEYSCNFCGWRLLFLAFSFWERNRGRILFENLETFWRRVIESERTFKRNLYKRKQNFVKYFKQIINATPQRKRTVDLTCLGLNWKKCFGLCHARQQSRFCLVNFACFRKEKWEAYLRVTYATLFQVNNENLLSTIVNKSYRHI